MRTNVSPAAEVGFEYWHTTFDDLAAAMAGRRSEFDNPDEPAKFKHYRGLPRYRLPADVPTELGAVGTAFAAHGGDRPVAPRLDTRTLSALAYYTFGVARYEHHTSGTWPHHRMVASARCLFPTQLYLWLSGVDGLSAGCYHYDPAHHTLVALRTGDYRAHLSTILGTDLTSADAVLMFSSLFWNTAYIYRDYAYRLCAQEAGMTAGNAQLVGGSLGFDTRLHHQFLDEPLDELFGLAPDAESAMVAVALYPPGTAPEHASSPHAGAVRPVPPARPSAPAATIAPGECPALTRIGRAARHGDPRGITASAPLWTATAPGVPVAGPAGHRCRDVDLARALRRRHSGPPVFDPTGNAVPAAALWRILSHALDPTGSDVVAPGERPLVDLYVTVNSVDGIAPGVYQLEPGRPALREVAGGRRTAELTACTLAPIGPYPGPNLATTNLVVHLVGDRDRILDRLGSRGYRIVNQDAGVVAHRVSVLCAAESLAARVTNSYRADAVRGLLRIDGTARTPIFQILVGATRPSTRYVSALTF